MFGLGADDLGEEAVFYFFFDKLRVVRSHNFLKLKVKIQMDEVLKSRKKTVG